MAGLPGDEYGLEHDGWQGEGMVQMELKWSLPSDVKGKPPIQHRATVCIRPWLAYGCSVGARFQIRKLGSAEGKCATVQRILADDRCVARVDGFDKGTKGEEIVDCMPSTVIRTTAPAYERGQKVLYLNGKRVVDAVVQQWVGAVDFEEGSRHLLNISGASGCPALNAFNHVPALMTAASYSEAQILYSNKLLETEDKVEDAITGNLLRIEDQLIYMASHLVNGGRNPGEYSAVKDVPDLVKLFNKRSLERGRGTFEAQPVLCRAGPGTGKTWMVKQVRFALGFV